MKKNFEIRSQARRQVAYTSCILVASFILSVIIEYRISKYANDMFIHCCVLSKVVICLVFLIIYIIILNKSKKIKCHIDLNNKVCKINNETIKYENIMCAQTITQIIFDVVDLYILYESKGKIRSLRFKDVSKINLYEMLEALSDK